MDKLQARIEKLEERQRQLMEQKKKLIQKKNEEERKQRTRRLIQKGALAEIYFNCESMTEEETKKLFIKISELQEVKNILTAI